MRTPIIPDLASQYRAQSAIADLRRTLDARAAELSGGLREDVSAATGGDPARLYALELQLKRLDAAGVSVDAATARTGVMQASLARVEALGDGIATGLLGAVSIGDDIGARQRAAEARGAFEDVVTALNARYGGRSLFAGAATEGPALADAETMLTAIAATTASAPDAATAATAIDDWFQAAGGGFETMGYLGATTDAPPAQIAPGQSLTYATRADSGAVRDLLAGLAKIVIGLEAPPAGDPDAASALFEEGARGLTGAIPGIVGERAALGEAEARIAETAAAQAAERTLLETARARLVAADPYDTATEFQAVEQQLQTVYTITARLAGLSLLNALR